MIRCNLVLRPSLTGKLLNSLLFLFFFILLAPLVSDGLRAADPPPEVTMFIYHRFGEQKYPTTSIEVERFREQLAYLMANHYQVISLSELVDKLRDKKPLADKTAVITIDDGYKSVYTEAWPILKSFGFPFTVFVYVKAVEQKYPDFLSWDQIREMKEAGVDFQDHSYSHFRLGDRSKGMAEDEYRSWISADLIKSARVMMERLGERPQYFAIPYGEYNNIVLEEAKSLGYEAIFSQDPGSVSNETDLDLIPREPILGDSWSSMPHFEMVLSRVDLPIDDIKPSIFPVSSLPTEFGCRILHPEWYHPESYEIYVSELGWVRPEFDGRRLTYKNEQPFTRRLNRVIVKAREKKSGRTAIRSWMLLKGVD